MVGYRGPGRIAGGAHGAVHSHPACRHRPPRRDRLRRADRNRTRPLSHVPGPMSDTGPVDGTALMVSATSRTLRRQLRPLDWVVLEEVALDAVDEDGRIIARTSARQIASPGPAIPPATGASRSRAWPAFLHSLRAVAVRPRLDVRPHRDHVPAGTGGLERGRGRLGAAAGSLVLSAPS